MTSLTVGKESSGMFLQQLAAVVTAVLCTLVAKKSRYVKHAVSPPSRTIDAGNSDEIFSRVCSQSLAVSFRTCRFADLR